VEQKYEGGQVPPGAVASEDKNYDTGSRLASLTPT
jgi:hypothetical protein